jgi:hypothetical protein
MLTAADAELATDRVAARDGRGRLKSLQYVRQFSDKIVSVTVNSNADKLQTLNSLLTGRHLVTVADASRVCNM